MIVEKRIDGEVFVEGVLITPESYRFPMCDPETVGHVFDFMPEGVKLDISAEKLAFLDTPGCRAHQARAGFRSPRSVRHLLAFSGGLPEKVTVANGLYLGSIACSVVSAVLPGETPEEALRSHTPGEQADEGSVEIAAVIEVTRDYILSHLTGPKDPSRQAGNLYWKGGEMPGAQPPAEIQYCPEVVLLMSALAKQARAGG